MIGIADQNKSYGIWAWVFCRNGMAFLFLFLSLLFIVNGIKIKYNMPGLNQHIFLFDDP